MLQNKNKDPLKELNWSALYDRAPQDFDPAVRLAFKRIHAREKRKKNLLRVTACAAVLALFCGVGAWQWSKRQSVPDQVDTVLAAPTLLTASSHVFSTKEDPYYHTDAACPLTLENEVALQLITAREFEKTPCPDCCANVQFEP